MTSLAIIQIIYLAINVIGTAIGLVWLWTAFEFSLVERLLAGSSKRWAQVVLSIIEILLVALFIPAITILALISLFFVIVGSNFGE
jgi:ABC-type multidrug transport system permease subunit